MAITLLDQPQAYMPAYSPAWWTASSTQTAAANFMYTVVFTDLITSATITKHYEQRPTDAKLVFDSNFFAEAYIEHYVPNNVYGFQKCTDAIRKIRVNIGETYGTTPTYYAGSNVDYIVWNGVMGTLDYVDYDYTDFVYRSNDESAKYLTDLSDRKTYSGKSLFLYALTSQANDLGSLTIKTYNSAGTLLGTSYIANPYVASTTYTDKYLCIDLGHKGLSQISSGLVTGTYPIMTSSVAYYTVDDVSTFGILATPPYTQTTRIFRVDVECEAKCDPYSANYLNWKGDFETLPLPKVSEINRVTNKTTYKQNPYELTSNVYSYSKFTAQEKVLNSSVLERISLQTDWLTYDQIDLHKDITESILVYLDYGSTTGLIPVVVETNSYKVLKSWNNGNPYFQITVRQGFTDTKQRG